MRALIADKSKLMRTILRSLCEERGFTVKEAEVAEKLSEQVRDATADLVLIDAGCDLNSLTQLRDCGGEGQHDTVIVLLSSRDLTQSECRSSMFAGANYLLLKPFKAIELDAILRSSGLEDRSRASTCGPEPTSTGDISCENSVIFREGCCV